MKTLIRLLINFVATAVIILIFRHIGWLEFIDPPQIMTDPALNDILIAGIIGFIFFIIGELTGIAFGALIVMTCGVGCLLYPIFGLLSGLIKLYGTQFVLPTWFTFDAIWWKALIISFSIGLFRIPSIKEKKVIVKKKK
ncbi:hypothetical protein ACFLY9_02370 [Patescibacteria group bacterium]